MLESVCLSMSVCLCCASNSKNGAFWGYGNYSPLIGKTHGGGRTRWSAWPQRAGHMVSQPSEQRRVYTVLDHIARQSARCACSVVSVSVYVSWSQPQAVLKRMN